MLNSQSKRTLLCLYCQAPLGFLASKTFDLFKQIDINWFITILQLRYVSEFFAREIAREKTGLKRSVRTDKHLFIVKKNKLENIN